MGPLAAVGFCQFSNSEALYAATDMQQVQEQLMEIKRRINDRARQLRQLGVDKVEDGTPAQQPNNVQLQQTLITGEGA